MPEAFARLLLRLEFLGASPQEVFRLFHAKKASILDDAKDPKGGPVWELAPLLRDEQLLHVLGHPAFAMVFSKCVQAILQVSQARGFGAEQLREHGIGVLVQILRSLLVERTKRKQ